MTPQDGSGAGELPAPPRSHWRNLPSWWIWIVAVSTVVATLAVLVGLSPVVRGPLVAWVVLVCPSVGFGYRSRAADPLARWVIGGVGAVGLATVVAELLLLSRAWSPTALLVVVGTVATLLVRGPLRWRRRPLTR